MRGKPLPAHPAMYLLRESVALLPGKNHISVVASNTRGVESMEMVTDVYYDPAQPPPSTLVYIGVGVSRYNDSLMNLAYAAKDAKDMGTRMGSMYDSSLVYLLTDVAASRDAVLQIREKLKQTSVNDVVVLSLAGHGLQDPEAGFVFAPHDMNFERPREKGLLLGELEQLLDDIPARKRLLLIDACHSGEAFDAGVAEAGSLPSGVKRLQARSIIRKMEVQAANQSRQAFLLMKELFSDFSRGNGAFVISAAAGHEYALEGEQWNNGVFTKSVIESLQELQWRKGSWSGRQPVKVRELRRLVYKKVAALTNGQQTPTSRQENGWWNWTF
jgi:hypothetical protein